MAKAQDFTKMVQDMLANFPIDTTAAQDAFKNQAALNEKLAKVVLEAAEKSNDLSSKWTKDTLGKLGNLTAVKDEPADYTKALTDFASASAEAAAENMAAYAEIAKKVQMETVELMLAAGKDFQVEATAAVKKAADEATAAAKKATAAAK
ncbi:phasin family protein [Actibacterium sp. XHP0104]|uniref:phasin family protein n=1 Tax=Actibacterium sp. XHP0104 TaxID=2984335 RepID=UPI0021E76B10|nr:phasin family protein [Actibacterium sp. XHP0104]MCV2882608.1 phasin family protein [Actibacterium sp. XHP0104]